MTCRWLSVVVLLGCGTQTAVRPSPAPAAVTALADLTPPALRLPTAVVPLHNTVELTILPPQDSFRGEITIDVQITAPISVVWLNASEITVEAAELRTGGERVALTALPPVKNFLGLQAPRALVPGRAQLVIRYRGMMRRDDGDGIYTAADHDQIYAFSHFEPTDARQAFPCFDEPAFKVPWQLTIHTRRALTAVANTPVAAEHDEPDDMKAVRFAETRPLPSYLVAFAVGPFELVEAGATRGGAPIRVVVPRGHRGEADYAARALRPLVDLLEDYFGSPYPYAKLDLVAAPVFNIGAMENPGLITALQPLILQPPAARTPDDEYGVGITLAHELAHQWFGDYVTLAWWDDTWLKESFATWLGEKIVERWQPTWNIASDRTVIRNGALRSDSLESARAVRQPIASTNDIANAFDTITYNKGGAVLAMLEQAIGPEVFQTGVRSYLAQHAWGIAAYDDFVAAMSAAAGRDLRPMFDAFIVERGAPLASFTLVCEAGAPPRLKLAQRRYAPLGSRIAAQQTWHLPLCVRWGAGARAQQCTTLDAAEGELVLHTPSCPAWIAPNLASLGYYRSLLAGALHDKAIAHLAALDLPERVGLVGDVRALVASGDLSIAAALQLVERLAGDRDFYVTDAATRVVSELEDKVPDALRGNYERLIRRLFGARARELGWQPRPGETANTRNLRASLVWLVAGTGADPVLGQQASALVARWLKDRSGIDRDLLAIALYVAAHRAGPALFAQLQAELARSTDRQERAQLFTALGAFVQPALAEQARALTLAPELDGRETTQILRFQLRDPRTRDAAYAFSRTHFDELAARLPARRRVQLSSLFAPLCDDDRRAEIEAELGPKIAAMEGGPRELAHALESLALCAAQRKAQAPDLAAVLKRE